MALLACEPPSTAPATPSALRIGDPILVGDPSSGTNNHATLARNDQGQVLVVHSRQATVSASLYTAELDLLDRWWVDEPLTGHHPQVASVGEDFLVAMNRDEGLWGYANETATPITVRYGQFVDLDVAADGRGWVVWTDDEFLWYSTFTGNFEGLATRVLPASTPNTAVDPPSVRVRDDVAWVLWSEVSAESARVWLTQINHDGDELGNRIALSEQTGRRTPRPTIALLDGGYAVSWRGKTEDSADGAWVQFFRDDHSAIADATALGQYGVADHVVVAGAGRCAAVTWVDVGDTGSSVWLQIFDGDTGDSLSEAVRVSGDEVGYWRRPYLQVHLDSGALAGHLSLEVGPHATRNFDKRVFMYRFDFAGKLCG